MFRIKTDIRQYKCENKAKVEKLIHNWVVRPSDLIFHDDAWHPIGKHPEFENIFNVLANEDKGDGDTIVTESPFEAEEQKEEETRTKSEDVFDSKDILADLSTQPDLNFAPPIAPEGVEPAHHDDEVTMMTDRTLDMLMDYDPSLKADIENKETEEKTQLNESSLAEDPDRTTDLPSSDETTEIKESPLQNNSDDETTDVKESPLTSNEDEETTNVIESPFQGDHPDDEPSLVTDASEEPTVVVDQEAQTNESERTHALNEDASAPKLGRHDLPEDLFATNEISKVNREDVEKRDDLNNQDTEHSVDDAWGEIESEFSEDDTIAENSDSFDEIEKDPNLEDSITEDSIAEDSTPEVLHINGYEIDFPFKIGPTPEDRKLGLKTSKYPLERREKTYPHPSEKKYKDPHIRSFSWKREPPKDLSYIVVALAVIALILIVLFLSRC